MPSATNRLSQVLLRTVFAQRKLAVIVAALICNNAQGQSNLDITASAQAESIYQDVVTESNGRRSMTTLTIEPKINAIYRSNDFSGKWTGTVTQLERENDTIGQKDTFAEYNYSANWQAIDRYLVIQASGALNYQNTVSSDYLITDFLTNSDSLSKTRSNQLSGLLTLDNGDWVMAQGSASYSDVASERASTTDSTLDNDTLSLNGTLASGDRSKRLIWALTGSYQNTQREESSQGDFISRAGELVVDAMMFNNWAIRLNATHEANQISDRTDTFSSTRKYDSYGAGLSYRQSTNRYIALTVNKSRSDLEEDDDETFVGVDMNWSLTNRTSFSASYGRRFYGESAEVKFSYNTKHFRSSFSYSEDITNTSRLLANPENLGVFVCPVDSSSIADCFQPSSLNYDTDASEELVQITTQNLEYDDNIILRKSSNTQIGYKFSRVTLGLAWQYAEDSYLDEDRLRRTYTGSTSLAYQLGSYTQLTSKISYANVAERGTDVTTGDSDNWNSSISITRTIGKTLSASLSMSYIDKSGDLTTNSVYGANYSDRRITLSAEYKYE